MTLKRIAQRNAILAVLLLAGLACNLPAAVVPSQSTATHVPTAISIHQTIKPTRRPTATRQPTATARPFSADNITVDYTYTAELITAIYHLYGNVLDDFVKAKITNQNDHSVRVIVRSEIIGYTDQASDTIDVPAGKTIEVRQNPHLTPTSIDSLDSAKPADFHIRALALDNGQERELLDQTDSISIYARRDFPWAIQGFTQQEEFDLLAAMVTPTDPTVEGFLRRAANYTQNGTMVGGYSSQNDEDGKVWDRLQAIWQAETQDYKLTYINTTVSYAAGNVQRMRLPADVLNQNSGNCIDLVLLYAAAAEALDLQPALVLVPGHAYLAIRDDAVNDSYYIIETTLIGRATFDDAVKTGLAEYQKDKPSIDNGTSDYAWVKVSEARKKGILPVPWK